MKQTFLKAYESPRAEVIEIESQGVLCVSDGGMTSSFSQGSGLHFGNNSHGGDWN